MEVNTVNTIKKRKLSTWSNPESKLDHDQPTIIPEELILYEILPWSPVEYLRELKFVCKRWHRVISKDLTFKKASQSRRSCVRHAPGLIYRAVENKYVYMDSSLNCMRLKVGDAKASSNGLLFGTHYKSKPGEKEHFYVMNPFTNERVLIPNTHGFDNVSFAFETSTETPYFALVSMDVVSEKREEKTLGFTVYLSETSEWKKAKTQIGISGKCCVTNCSVSQNRTVYVGGRMYWKIEGHVFWLHIKEHSSGTVTVPNFKEDEPKGEIGDCDGELSYSMTKDGNIEIWVLRSLRWVQMYCLSIRDIVENCDGRIDSCCYDAVFELSGKMVDMIGKKRVKTRKSEIDGLHRVLPFEGGDVQFWVKHGKGFKTGVIFSYNVKTRAMRIIHNSEMERYGVCLLSWKSSLASVPVVNTTVYQRIY